MTVIGKKIGFGEIEGATFTTTTEGNCKGQKGDPGPQGPAGTNGPNGLNGLNGLNGAPGPKILNGTGDPDNWLTPLSVLGDYYLDSNTGNLWQREAFSYDFTPTIIDLPGGVRWRRIAVLKGPAGQNLQLLTKTMAQFNANENQVLQDTYNPSGSGVPTFSNILSLRSTDGLKGAMLAITQEGRVFYTYPVEPGNLTFWKELYSKSEGFVIDGQDPYFLLRKYDADQEVIVDALKVTVDAEAGNSNVYFKALKNNVLHNFLQYYAGNKFLSLDGINGFQLPRLTLAEMTAILPSMSTGFLAYCTDTQTLRVTTLTGWADLMLNAARLVLGGVDNNTDRLQVTGTTYFSSFINIAANGLKMQGSQTLLYSGGALYHYAYGGGHVFTKGAGDITLFEIKADGRLIVNNTITAAGTTGAQTINKPSGTVNMAAGQNSLVVTNSCVSANSLVFCEIRTNDATAQIKNVVPAAGSFTIRLTANATAETSIGFFVVNF